MNLLLVCSSADCVDHILGMVKSAKQRFKVHQNPMYMTVFVFYGIVESKRRKETRGNYIGLQCRHT